MISKYTFQTINNIVGWIISVSLIGLGLFHLFVHKISLNGSNFIILWSLIGLSRLSNIIDAKFFENNFSLKNNWHSVFGVVTSIIFIIAGFLL
ncbi:putative membrane protein [Anaerosolibacter carboniphilus]|uniref:Putative membrane protein n=1 Tax=Anaerosolibacter carboniphilus TaxID=1417629 RepID=A0A841L921_9FIRM|nr:putative membrane protein [Anaerosolibacter carboniphilus]